MNIVKSITINEADNVCVLLEALGDIPAGHKIALCDIKKGEPVIKYGYPIGHASADIKADEHVHTHNVETNLKDILSYEYVPEMYEFPHYPCDRTFMGYVRENGDVGIRNELWIVPTVGCVDAIGNCIVDRFLEKMECGSLPKGIDDIKILAHPYGCGQEGYDYDNTINALAMAVNHPNAGGVLVLGLGCEDNRIEDFKKTLKTWNDKRVRFLQTQDVEDEIEIGAQLLYEVYEYTKNDVRTSVPISKLRIGMECGGSDGFSGLTGNPLLGKMSDYMVSHGGSTVMTEVAEMFGAEQILMNRAENREVFEKIVSLINDYKQYCFDNNATITGNPSPGNIDGGITTLEDKALGCTQKGGRAYVTDVLGYAQPLTKPGFNLLYASGSDTAGTTALGLCCQMVVFTTGRGTPYGGFIPTVKLATNTPMYERKKNWNDFNAGRIVDGESIDDLLSEFMDLIIEIASGKKCKAEINGFKEFVIWKNGISE